MNAITCAILNLQRQHAEIQRELDLWKAEGESLSRRLEWIASDVERLKTLLGSKQQERRKNEPAKKP